MRTEFSEFGLSPAQAQAGEMIKAAADEVASLKVKDEADQLGQVEEKLRGLTVD
jgi:hypothetical protein